jgi:hypothetical protein
MSSFRIQVSLLGLVALALIALPVVTAPLAFAADTPETAGWTIVIESEFPSVDAVMVVEGWYDLQDKTKTRPFTKPIALRAGQSMNVPAEAMPQTLREARQMRWWVDVKTTFGVEPAQQLDSTKEDDQKKIIRYRLD